VFRFCVFSLERPYFALFFVRFNSVYSRRVVWAKGSNCHEYYTIVPCYNWFRLSYSFVAVARVSIVSLYRIIEHSDSVSGVRNTNFKTPSFWSILVRWYGYNVTIRSIDYNFLRQTSIVSSLLLFLSARFIHCKSCIIRCGFGRMETELSHI